MESAWTISELAELAGAALADEPVQVNGRVRDTPNERLIRWYTTIGLLDPPSGRRGRSALYGPRHLLQLVAVKRRQAAGSAIAEIQAELTGATDATLRDIARVPESVLPSGPDRTPAARRAARARFWADAPSAAAPSPAVRPAAALRFARTAADGPEEAPGVVVVPGLRLAAGVTLLLDDGAHEFSADDLAAIEAAARPLLHELRRRGIHAAPPEDPDRTEPAPPAAPGR
ncbi:MAG TPA: MerR family transcriptional regulator [Streptosporangiaceae bacterium]|jgi:DNA-binding transcriptional MerR regulator